MNLGSTKRIAEIYQKHENKIKIAVGVAAVGVVGFLITKMLTKKRNGFAVRENIDIDKLRENAQTDPKAAYKMAEYLYSQAVSDQDLVIVESIKYYIRAVEGGMIDATIRVADIYNFCNIPQYGIPNKKRANELYQWIVKHGTSTEIKLDAISKSNVIKRDNQVHHLGRSIGRSTLGRVRNQEPVAAVVPNLDEELPVHIIEIMFQNMERNDDVPRMPIPVGNRERQVGAERARNDSQNVHDSGVQRSMKSIIDRLRENGRYNEYINTPEKTKKEIEDYIKNSGRYVKKQQEMAKTALETVVRVSSSISNTDTNEREIMNMVWNRINHPDNARNVGELKHVFVSNLVDCIKNGNPVCASGRATRMISSLEILDADPNIGLLKPKWVIKDEMMQTAANIRNGIVAGLSPEESNAYNAVEPSPLQEQIVDNIKLQIERQIENTYLKPKLLTKQEVDIELKPILDEI